MYFSFLLQTKNVKNMHKNSTDEPMIFITGSKGGFFQISPAVSKPI